MKASELMEWAVSLLEFEVPIELEPPLRADSHAPAPAEIRVRFSFYLPDADRKLPGPPMDLVLNADDEAGVVKARLIPTVELRGGGHSSADLANWINRLGSCCATYYDPHCERLIIQSAIRHKQHHMSGIALLDLDVGRKEATLNWLVDVIVLAQKAESAISRTQAGTSPRRLPSR